MKLSSGQMDHIMTGKKVIGITAIVLKFELIRILIFKIPALIVGKKAEGKGSISFTGIAFDQAKRCRKIALPNWKTVTGQTFITEIMSKQKTV